MVATSQLDFQSGGEYNLSAVAIKGIVKQSIGWADGSCGYIETYIGLSSFEHYLDGDKRYILVKGLIRQEVIEQLNPVKVAIFKASDSEQAEAHITTSSSRKKGRPLTWRRRLKPMMHTGSRG